MTLVVQCVSLLKFLIYVYPSVVTKGKTKVILWSKHHIMTVCGRVSKSFMHTFSLDVGK